MKRPEAITRVAILKILYPDFKKLDELKRQYAAQQICHYCKRQMDLGAAGFGEEKWGCYKDDCSIKEKHSKYDYYHINLAPISSKIYDIEEAIKKAGQILRLIRKD